MIGLLKAESVPVLRETRSTTHDPFEVEGLHIHANTLLSSRHLVAKKTFGLICPYRVTMSMYIIYFVPLSTLSAKVNSVSTPHSGQSVFTPGLDSRKEDVSQ